MGNMGMNSVSGSGANQILSLASDEVSSMINDIARYTEASGAGRDSASSVSPQTSMESRGMDIIARANFELGGIGGTVNEIA